MALGIGRPGYYHHADDATQTATAQRATFTPTLSNKLSGWALDKGGEKMQKLGHAIQYLRNKDLTLRKNLQRSNQSRRVSTIERAARREAGGLALAGRGNSDRISDIDQRSARDVDQAHDQGRLKRERLEWKQFINEAPSTAEMTRRIATANKAMGEMLGDSGYVPLGGLAQRAPEAVDPAYLSNAQGRRVRANYTQPPLLARAIAQATSAQYDNGVSGADQAFRRTVQYGAVGVRNATLLAKQGFYAAGAMVTHSDGERHDTFLRRAGKARDMRGLNTAALRGNVVLGETFSAINNARFDANLSRLTSADRGYQFTRNQAGVAPARTSWTTRNLNSYFAGGEDSMKNRRWLASKLVGLRNIVPAVKMAHHDTQMRMAEKDRDSGAPEVRQEAGKRYEKNAARRFNVLRGMETRKAALAGKLPEAMARFDAEFQDRYGV